jgi:hypothetical protein
MCRKSSLCVVLALLAVGALWVGSASAGAIPIPNYSFEDDVLADGTTGDAIWGTWYSPEAVATNADPIGHPSTYRWFGRWNPMDGQFPGTTGTPGVPTGGEGQQFLVLTGEDALPTNEIISAPLGTLLTAGTYTLTAAIGCQIPSPAQNYELVLGTIESGDLVRTGFGAATVPSGALLGTFADASTSVAIGSAHLGEQLYIKLVGTNAAVGGALAVSGPAEVCFDNIRLDGAPLGVTPEPGTLAILVSGLIGLLCYAWRKRK